MPTVKTRRYRAREVPPSAGGVIAGWVLNEISGGVRDELRTRLLDAAARGHARADRGTDRHAHLTVVDRVVEDRSIAAGAPDGRMAFRMRVAGHRPAPGSRGRHAARGADGGVCGWDAGGDPADGAA